MAQIWHKILNGQEHRLLGHGSDAVFPVARLALIVSERDDSQIGVGEVIDDLERESLYGSRVDYWFAIPSREHWGHVRSVEDLLDGFFCLCQEVSAKSGLFCFVPLGGCD